MSLYDKKYLEIAKNILDYGYYDKNRTINSTYKLPHQIMQFDLEKEFPILTTKFIGFKTAIKEILWIYKDQSNNVKQLQAQNVHIWDEWMKEDGTIGEAYGFVVKKYKQMDSLIEALRNNPQDRRMIIDLWQIPHLSECALPPCCFLTLWDVTDGRLNCMLVQRSADIPYGVPFNTTQYATLTHMLAQVSGLKPGLFTHIMNNAHIYENQIDGMKKQIENESVAYDAPKLWINPDITNFYDFTIDDVKLINYKHHGKISMGDVSV